AGIGEDDTLSAQFVVDGAESITVALRFLRLQHRQAECGDSSSGYRPVDELKLPSGSWLSWDEAVEVELLFGPFEFGNTPAEWELPVSVPGGTDVEIVDGGRLVRTRQPVHAALSVSVESDDGLYLATVEVRNTAATANDKQSAIATSLIGTHMIVEAVGGEFVSLLEPPDSASSVVARCRRHRCFPVLAGRPDDRDLLLISPIILYDHPEIAEQSEGNLFDSTEIDEILTLRVMTMTDEEK